MSNISSALAVQMKGLESALWMAMASWLCSSGSNHASASDGSMTSANYYVVVNNSYGSVTSQGAVVTVTTPGNPVTPPSGLVAWWRGEGNTVDSMGGNNGTKVGTVGYGSGKVGNAFVFDGNDGSTVYIGNPSCLQTRTFTIETWIKRARAL